MSMPSRIARPASDALFTSGPASGFPTKVQPSAGVEAQGIVPGQNLYDGHVNYYLENHASAIDALMSTFFGNGTDGAQTIAGTTTLTDDMHATTLVVQAGGVLHTNGFRVFASTSIVVDAGGVIACDGSDGGDGTNGGAPGTGGAGRVAGTLGAIGIGANGGGVGGNGVAGTNATSALGGDGGAGGDSAAAQTGGVEGSAIGITAAQGRHGSTGNGPIGHVLEAIRGRALDGTQFVGGAPGGGGAGEPISGTGGGSGSPGGYMVLASPSIENNGTVRAEGGDGGDGGTAPAGGGGGGGGGAIARVVRYGVTGSGTWSVAGGAGGSSGTGQPGDAGTDGRLFTFQI